MNLVFAERSLPTLRQSCKRPIFRAGSRTTEVCVVNELTLLPPHNHRDLRGIKSSSSNHTGAMRFVAAVCVLVLSVGARAIPSRILDPDKNVQFSPETTDNTAAGICSRIVSEESSHMPTSQGQHGTRHGSAGFSIPRGNMGHLSTFREGGTSEQLSNDLGLSTGVLPGEASFPAYSGDSLRRRRVKRHRPRKRKGIMKRPRMI
ncbi:uncharacterized protein LOC135105406 [Scylla paramamosain]|uniref:uncharacterized protein LOC135105406 n=1 Tax=Scylla paramamosain TaxID=85552 RepID=UPI003082E1AD